MDPSALLITHILTFASGVALTAAVAANEIRRLKERLDQASKNDNRDPKSGRYVAS